MRDCCWGRGVTSELLVGELREGTAPIAVPVEQLDAGGLMLPAATWCG